MENQIEKKMENEMETMIKLGIIDLRKGTVAPTVGPVWDLFSLRQVLVQHQRRWVG